MFLTVSITDGPSFQFQHTRVLKNGWGQFCVTTMSSHYYVGYICYYGVESSNHSFATDTNQNQDGMII